MHQQPSLFDQQPTARSTDPHTSHLAAASITRTHISTVQTHIIQLLTQHGPMTDEQIADRYRHHVMLPACSPSGLRTRRSELVAIGTVRDSQQRGITASGRATIIWELVTDDD